MKTSDPAAVRIPLGFSVRSRAAQLLIALLIFLHGHAFSADEFTDIKFFALDPGQYVGKSVALRGTVRTSGPALSWFILEDDTGKVLVTTVDTGVSLLCVPGALVELDGKLTFLGDDYGLYFAMNRMRSCATAAWSFDRLFALWMHKLLEI
jgi:hypothetical protein